PARRSIMAPDMRVTRREGGDASQQLVAVLVSGMGTMCGHPASRHRCSLKGTVMNDPTHEEKRRIFERHSLLGKLSSSEIDTLLAYSRVERYPAGREIFAKGSAGQSMMAVLRGIVKMSSVSPEGKEI